MTQHSRLIVPYGAVEILIKARPTDIHRTTFTPPTTGTLATLKNDRHPFQFHLLLTCRVRRFISDQDDHENMLFAISLFLVEDIDAPDASIFEVVV
jgi:hypothetical protein